MQTSQLYISISLKHTIKHAVLGLSLSSWLLEGKEGYDKTGHNGVFK